MYIWGTPLTPFPLYGQLLTPPARRLRQLVLIGLGSIATFSCKKEAEAVQPPADATAYAVTAAQATTAAENIALSAGVAAQRRRSQQAGDTQRVFQGQQRVLNLTPLPAADGQPGLYLCNYAQGGFAIIAADRHMQPILAFAERGALPTSTLEGTRAVPEGLASWLETTRQVAAALRQNPSEKNTAPGATAAWTALVDKPGDLAKTFFTVSGPAYRVPADDTPPADPPPVQVGPLMQTTWNQGTNYNDYTPASNNSGYNYHCPTGCVATAMAQVMRYWRYPTYYDWANMPASYGTPTTARLMADLGYGPLHMEYKPSSSSADDDYIDDGLKRNYGYRSAEYISSQDPGLYQTVVNNLNSSQPVILGGASAVNWFGYQTADAEAHCWVCDGYIQSYYQGNGYLQYYMNWSWGGSYNGWFSYNNWKVVWSDGTGHEFNYVKTYTLNIHP